MAHPFVGDYVRVRHNMQWKRMSIETNDQYVVFADIINKITRSNGKVAFTDNLFDTYGIFFPGNSNPFGNFNIFHAPARSENASDQV